MLQRFSESLQRLRTSPRAGAAVAIILVVVVILLAFWRLVFFDAAIHHDVRTQLYPWSLFISDALNDGQLPLWNPYAHLGYPMHLDMQARVWFPPVWVLALTVGYSFKLLQLELIGYIVLASLTAFWCGRVFGASLRAAFIVAVSFALSGAFVGNAQHLPWLISLALLPAHLALWRRAQASGSLWAHLLVGASLGLVFLGGYPGFFIVSSTVIGVLIIVWGWRERAQIAAIAGRLITVAGAAAASSAVLLLPVLAARGEFTRGHLDLGTVYNASVNPVLLLQTLIPSLAVGTKDYVQLSLPNANLYFGVVTLCLLWTALVALPKRDDAFDRLFIWLGALTLLLCFGKYGFLRGVAYQFLPGFDQFRFPALFRGYFIFSACMLAGYAYDWFFARGEMERLRTLRRTTTVIAALVLAIVLVVFVASLFFDGVPASSRLGELDYPIFDRVLKYGPQQVLFLLLLAVVLARAADGRIARSTAGLLVAAVVVLDLSTSVNTNFYTVGDTSPDFGRFVALEAERPPSMAPDSNRIKQNFQPRGGSLANDLMTKRRLQTGGYNPFQLRATRELLQLEAHSPIVKQGLVFVTDRALVVDDALTEIETGRVMPPRVTLDRDPGIELAPGPNAPGSAVVKTFELNRIAIRIDADRDLVLVMNQAAFPGWRVEVDGSEQPLLRADHALRAVAVPAGRHQVVFSYRPRLLVTGAVVTALFWGALAAIGAGRILRRRFATT